MDLDQRTLAIVLVVTDILQVFVFFLQYRISKTYRGIGWWAFGFTWLALGFGFQFLPGADSLGLFGTFAINFLLVLGTVFLYIGTRRFLEHPDHQRMIYGLLGAFSLFLLYFIFGVNAANVRTLVGSALVAVFSFLTASSLLARKTRAFATLAYFNAAIFFAHGCFFIYRAITALAISPAGTGASSFQPMVYLISLIEGILLTFGLIVMVNQRLSAEYRQAKENLEAIIAASPDGIRIIGLDGCVTFASPKILEWLGLSEQDILGHTTLDWIAPEDRARAEQDMANVFQGIFTKQNQYRLRRKDGTTLWGETNAAVLKDEQGKPSGMLTITRNVTERKQMEDALRESEARFRSYFELPLAGRAISSPQKNWLDVNATLCAMLGYTKTEMMERTWEQLTCPDDVPADVVLFNRVLAGEQDGFTLEKRFIHKDGHLVYADMAVQCLRRADGTVDYFVALIQDSTARKHLEAELREQAITDELTGVFNRRHFLDLAQTELERAFRLHQPFAIALIDLDHFKQINDTHGHATGDLALKAFTKICCNNIRAIDVFARFGGDEFALLLPGTDCVTANQVIERVRAVLLANPLIVDEVAVSLSLSAGVACLGTPYESFDLLLSRADQALYRAKEAGRNRVEIESGAA